MSAIIEHLMDLHDAAAEVRHTDGAPEYNGAANNARNAFRAALEAHISAPDPELLAACMAVDAHYGASLDHQPTYVQLARMALAKATGAAA